MNEESHNPRIDPELEARIVALVLGEASDFECDELNRLVDQRPELAALKQQIQEVHGLLRDVATGDAVAEDDDWKLSSEKRSAVLAVISGATKQEEQQPAKDVVRRSAEQQRSVKGNLLWNVTKIAAVFLCVVGYVGFTSMRALFNSLSRSESQRISRAFPGAASSTDDAGIDDFTYEKHFSTADPQSVADLDYLKDSKSALSDIQESLAVDATRPSPYYLMDDVQYFPQPPGFKLPPEAAETRAASKSNTQASPPNRLPAPAAGVNGPGPPPKTPSTAPVAPKPSSGVISGFRHDGEVERWGAANKRAAVSGADDRPEPQRPPDYDLGFPMLEVGSQESGQGQDSSPGRSRQLGGAYFQDSFGREDSAVAKSGQAYGIAAGGGGFGGGSGGGGLAVGGTETTKSEEEISAEHDLAEIAEKESSGGLAAGPLDSRAPANPTATAGKEAENHLPGVRFGGGELADAIPSPAEEPFAAREFFKREGEPSDRSITFENGRASLGRQGESNPVTGTSIGQPLGEALPGQAKQEGGREYETTHGKRRFVEGIETGKPATRGEVGQDIEMRAKDSLAKLFSELHDLNDGIAGNVLPDNYRTGAETYWKGRQTRRNEGQDELLKRRDQRTIDGRNHWHAMAGDIMTPDDVAGRRFGDEAKKHAAPAGLNEKTAAEEAFSTFSLHVSDVSFKLAQAALSQGEWPEPARVRIEEFVNAFDYGDPMPSQSEKVSCRVEQSIHPFLQQRNVLRVSLRTAAAGRSSNTPLRLTLLLDNSGSMERIDRQQTVRRAFALLAQQLKPMDQVTLISFARRPRLLADKVSGAQSRQLVELIGDLPSEGGTNFEAALQLAFEKAQEQQDDTAQNRIILLTDGAVNLGDANPVSLSQMITTIRNAGIAFDAAGISAEGLNDEILEALTRQGDGRYYLLDSLEAADDGFARQIAGALRPSAKNVKVQIEFNPKRVGRYKLLGFEKHRLKQEDFRNDKVDAAEMAAAEAGVAMYQFEAKPDGEGDVGSVSVRFRDLSSGQMIENCWPIPYEADAPRADQAAPSLRIATSAALLAAKLKGEPLGETVDLKTLSNLIAGLPDRDRNSKRVGQLQLMIGQARQVSGQ